MGTATFRESTRPTLPEHDRSRPVAARRRKAPPGRNVGSTERIVSILGGSVLALYGIRRLDRTGLGIAALGAATAGRGISGRSRLYETVGISTADEAEAAATSRALLHATVTIDADPHRLYGIWREPKNLTRFMTFFEDVEAISDTRARWKLAGPFNTHFEWETEIVAEVEGNFIYWHSMPGSPLPHDGEVRFQPAPGNRGTEVHVWLTFDPPGGPIGSLLAAALDEPAELKLRGDLRRLKQWIETGEIATTEGQPRGR